MKQKIIPDVLVTLNYFQYNLPIRYSSLQLLSKIAYRPPKHEAAEYRLAPLSLGNRNCFQCEGALTHGVAGWLVPR